MKIDIVTVTYNCRDYIRNFLEGLYRKTGRDFNLYIFDNSSSDGSKEILREYELLKKNIKIIYSDKNINFGPANNYLVKNFCREKLLLFINNDIIFTDNWLDNLINGMKETDADMVGAKLIYPDNKTIQHCGIEFDICGMPHHIYRFATAELLQTNKRREFPNVTAACMLMKRQEFLDVGGFDEKYINGYEDNDLCMKLFVNKKKIVYEPKCELFHFESVSPGISDQNIFSGNYFFERWKHLTLKMGYESLKNVKGKVSIYGTGEKAKHLIQILKEYDFEIEKIYDRKGYENKLFGKIYGIDEINKFKPENLIVASVSQYLIIEDLKKILSDDTIIIPVCRY